MHSNNFSFKNNFSPSTFAQNLQHRKKKNQLKKINNSTYKFQGKLMGVCYLIVNDKDKSVFAYLYSKCYVWCMGA